MVTLKLTNFTQISAIKHPTIQAIWYRTIHSCPKSVKISPKTARRSAPLATHKGVATNRVISMPIAAQIQSQQACDFVVIMLVIVAAAANHCGENTKIG